MRWKNSLERSWTNCKSASGTSVDARSGSYSPSQAACVDTVLALEVDRQPPPQLLRRLYETRSAISSRPEAIDQVAGSSYLAGDLLEARLKEVVPPDAQEAHAFPSARTSSRSDATEHLLADVLCFPPQRLRRIETEPAGERRWSRLASEGARTRARHASRARSAVSRAR
jgi:hypothetical protein